MRVLVNGLSVRSLSGQHVLLGHLRQLAQWTGGQHVFFLLHDATQAHWSNGLPANVERLCIAQSLTHWLRRSLWETLVLPRLLQRVAVDLVFTTSGTVLPRCHVPQVSLAQNPWCFVPQIHLGPIQRQKAVLQRHAYRQAMHRAAMMVYNSCHIQDLYRKNAGGPFERASRVVYQAIDDTTHRAAASTARSIAKQAGLVLSVSVMAPWKGIDVLVEALAILHQQGCRARLRLVGPWADRHYEAQVRRRIAKLRLDDWVVITGQVGQTELYRHYAEAKVFCLMSQCESFGIPAVEAQAFGTPVVGATGCAMPEVCGPGGAYGPPRDPQRTASLLALLLEDAGCWETLSRQARENAARYRWEACSAPLMDMFSLTAAR